MPSAEIQSHSCCILYCGHNDVVKQSHIRTTHCTFPWSVYKTCNPPSRLTSFPQIFNNLVSLLLPHSRFFFLYLPRFSSHTNQIHNRSFKQWVVPVHPPGGLLPPKRCRALLALQSTHHLDIHQVPALARDLVESPQTLPIRVCNAVKCIQGQTTFASIKGCIPERCRTAANTANNLSDGWAPLDPMKTLTGTILALRATVPLEDSRIAPMEILRVAMSSSRMSIRESVTSQLARGMMYWTIEWVDWGGGLAEQKK